MGSDDLSKKRRAKRSSDLKRKRARRQERERILIVCEGRKTEPNYFNEIRILFRLSSTDVEITHDRGSDPKNVVLSAKKKYAEEKSIDPYNYVYCVFDRDSHSTFNDALQMIAQAKPKGVFKAITSVPCFDYWLLLHFEPSEREYSRLPGRSPCTQLISSLKKHLPDYEKGKRGLFEKLRNKLEIAKKNAAKSSEYAKSHGSDKPSTKVHLLVEKLEKMKDR